MPAPLAKTILIVDDEVEGHEALSDFPEIQGYRVDAGMTGKLLSTQ
jgi:CheY-like chemotaxis protein